MKRIRFGSALLVLGMALSFGLASGPGSTTSANEAAPKCTCRYPNTDEWGVKTTNDCNITDCWVDVEETE